MPPIVGLAARTVRGLEWVAAEEIETALPGARRLELAVRQVNFTMPGEEAAAAATLRTVDDVFLRAGAVRGVGTDRKAPAQLARAVTRLDLAGALDALRRARRSAGTEPLLDVVVSLGGSRRYNRYDVEDAVGAEVGRILSAAYVSRRDGPPPATGFSLRVAVTGDRAEVLFRLGSQPLHRRPWKVATGPGTLHPPVAAALVRLAGSPPLVIDPCCGDGTILIEAATSGAVAIGADLDPRRVRNSGVNAARARCASAVGLVRADAAALPLRDAVALPMRDAAALPMRDAALPVRDGAGLFSPQAGGAAVSAAIVTNPPWNRAVGAGGGLAESLGSLWNEAGRVLDGSGVVALVEDAGGDATTPESSSPESWGWRLALRQQARLAGRVVVVSVASAQDQAVLPEGLDRWRRRSIDAGVTTATGF
ncbi:hypothetical protein K6U06_23295 [Acidiferrimicrobium sp. IK]|uniref:hypothetical protein n=1 Tax=Acidiferrimicrobium sp. IK TaxID=2871700 RepID=UPI0021CB911A|nr:hypothetical protein [Acidiferrimicrobium sp. IK]MCU4187308.1 hypothetical protein [Acidiferrimicrobium sp. IK]